MALQVCACLFIHGYSKNSVLSTAESVLQVRNITHREGALRGDKKPIKNCGNFGVFIKHVLMGKDMYNNKAILLVAVFNISPNFINTLILTGRKAGKVHLVLIRGMK